MSDEFTERLLLADHATIKAVVAWRAIPKSAGQSEPPRLTEWAPGIWYDAQQWMTAAGLSMNVFGEISGRCRTLGFIDEQGDAWPPIIVYARALAAKNIKEKTRGKT